MYSDSQDIRSVRIWQFPKAMFAWPLAVFSCALYFLYQAGLPSEVLAWSQFIVLAGVFLALALDVDIQALVISGLIGLIILFGSLWITQGLGIPIWQNVWQIIAGLNVQFNQSTALLWAGVGTILVVYSLSRAIYDGFWRMTHNELRHNVLFRRSRSFARGAKTVEAEYPDLMEFILGFGAGTLIVRDSRSQQEINRLENVFLLAFKMRKLNKLLRVREVFDVTDDYEDEDESGTS